MNAPYDGLRNAVVFDDLKQAALYFDRVIPVCLRQIRGGHGKIIVEIPEEVPANAFVDLVYGAGSGKSALYPTLFFDFFDRWSDFINAASAIRRTGPRSNIEDDYSDLPQLYQLNAQMIDGTTIRQLFHRYSRSLGAEYSTVVIFNPTSAAESRASDAYYALTLLNLPLVNVRSASWEQIIEFRQDDNATKKLRRLRVFFYENYAGKPVSFIKDDFLKRIDDYELARKKHGFEAVVGCLSSILSAKNLTTAIATGVAAALFGGPIVGAASSAIVEVGNLAIEFSKKLYAIRDFSEGHDFAYLFEARQRLK
jgi:hypothetical protein